MIKRTEVCNGCSVTHPGFGSNGYSGRADVTWPSGRNVGNNILLWPGKLVIAGFPQVGRSFIELNMIRALATGRPMFGCPWLPVRKPVRVLLVDSHNGTTTLDQRVHLVFPWCEMDALNRVSCVSLREHRPLNYDAIDLERLIDETQPNVVVIDKMADFLHGAATEKEGMAKMLDRVNAIEAHRDLGLSFILICTIDLPEDGGLPPASVTDALISAYRADAVVALSGKMERIGCGHTLLSRWHLDNEVFDLTLSVHVRGEGQVVWEPPKRAVSRRRLPKGGGPCLN